MSLVIVESPNKCSKIKKILGAGYVVMASVGHIMDLEKKNMGIEIEGWVPSYKTNDDKKEVVRSLKAEAKKHDKIYIATDDDFEGEIIAHNLREILPKRGKEVYRVIFPTITKADVLKGIKTPVGFREGMIAAQQARRITDRLMGFKLSPVLWSKGLKNMSAGRVQSAALKFVVDREKAIRAFIPKEYWTIIANMADNFDAAYYSKNKKKHVPSTEKEVKVILSDIKKDLVVTGYSKKNRTRGPSAPFITSTLQKEAGSKFGWTGKKVMDVAQDIFSQGLITYHRTDSTRVEPSKIKEIREKIENKHGKNYLSKTINQYKPKAGSQDAHEAIRPTFEAVPMSLSSDGRKLLELITNKFMASQMADAIFESVSIELTGDGKKDSYQFRASGSILKFDGFLKVYGAANKDLMLPNMKKGDKLKVKKYTPKQNFTKPLPRYTDPGTFTDMMEREGIGRPATYAATMDVLIRRGYVKRNKQAINATEIGIMVSDYLTVHFKDLTSSNFTAAMETNLDKIASEDKTKNAVLDLFYETLTTEIDSAKKKKVEVFKTDVKCKKCKDGSIMIKKVSKDKRVFLGCENYPKCGHTVNFSDDGEAIESEVETGLACPVCANIIEKKTGKYGDYYVCSGRPTCTWTGSIGKNDEIVEKKKGEDLGLACPQCKTGTLIKRSGKWGKFVACSKYKDGCKFTGSIDDDGNVVAKKAKSKAASGKKTGKKCPKCKTGELVERPSKYGSGTWTSCNGFPKCRYIEK